MSILLDPSVIFGLSVYLSPLFMSGAWAKPQELFSYFTDPVSLIGASVLAFTVLATKYSSHPAAKLTASGKRAALWYLMNGVVIHTMMDGLVGSFARYKYWLPEMTNHYSKLDRRFVDGEPHALTVTLTELCIMGPLCLLSYRARVLGRPYAPVVEAAASAFQLFGTLVFVIPEIVLGYPNVPVDSEFKFDFHSLLYFWFAFVFCNPIWIVIPAVLIYNAVKKVTALTAAAAVKKTK